MYNPDMSLTLARALRADESRCFAFVGSGGKTTAIFQLAKELKPLVVITATSHLGSWQTTMADKHLVAVSKDALKNLETELIGIVLITGEINSDRTEPVNDEVLGLIHEYCLNHSIPMLIEADGSRQKALKGWAGHEPPIPDFVDHVVTVAGLSGLGKPLSEGFIHRPELFSEMSGTKVGDTIDSNSLTRVLLHDNSSLKNIPSRARRTVLLNQADKPDLQAGARAMSQALLSKYQSVVISSLEQGKVFAAHEPVAGIILAAGESSRYGKAKQLLEWKGEAFVRVVAKRALEAGLAPVIVVTGANAEQVEIAVKDLNVLAVRNTDWKSGQASSIRAGIQTLRPPPSLPQIRRRIDFDPDNMLVGFGGGARKAEGGRLLHLPSR